MADFARTRKQLAKMHRSLKLLLKEITPVNSYLAEFAGLIINEPHGLEAKYIPQCLTES